MTGQANASINCQGQQVSLAELEDVVASHPAVSETHIIGVPDPVAGEIPKAFVVLERTNPLGEIAEYVAARVAPHQRVRAIERVRAIPRSSTGTRMRPTALRVMITGGGGGLGRAFAVALGASGASVIVVGRDGNSLAETVQKIRNLGGTAAYVTLDLTDESSVRRGIVRVVDEWGGIDVLVNNAGVPGPIGPLWEVDEREWRRTFEVNLFGSVLVTGALLPELRSRVVNVVSRAGKVGWPLASAYAASKAALISLTASLAGELDKSGRVAVAFDPGLVDSGMTRAHIDRGRTGVRYEDEILEWTLKALDSGYFTSVATATSALVAVAMGAADHVNGLYVHVEAVSSLLRSQPAHQGQ